MIGRLFAAPADLASQRLDLSTLAQLHLYKSLVKLAAVRDSPALPPYVKSKLNDKPLRDSRTVDNVRARLLNSNPVKAVLEQTLFTVCRALQLPRDAAKRKTRLRSADYNGAASSQHARRDGDRDQMLPSSQDSWGGFSSSQDEGGITGTEKGRTTSADGVTPDLHSVGTAAHEGSVDMSDTDTDAGKRPLPATRASQYPLLGNGYVSGSSDAESLPVDEAKPRKNRRGQQERRAIWQKKFGSAANHVKRVQSSRDHGWDAKQGALGSSAAMNHTGSTGRRRRSPALAQADQANRRSREKFAERSEIRKTVSDAPLHPSWEAARRAKERTGTQVRPFEGTRLVFE